MQLTLSSKSVRNTIFTNEIGQVLYKTLHLFKLGSARTTTIRKVIPNEDPTDMRDQFEVMGKIEWRFTGSSTFHFQGNKMQSGEFLPRHGIRGRIESSFPQLSRDDGSKTEVARYHRGSLGIVGPKQKPYLDIDPSVMGMLDLIIFTFVYVEKLRMDKERGPKSAGKGEGS
ncbi:hypothetical protein JVU11DRAFT_3161 [Chiua virens]|nr:hypothetical protein JVU11DRAFT_3161 [Chiua virens]